MEYLIHIAIMVGIYALLSVSLNLVAGYTGLVSLVHAGFLGIGAYTVGILTTKYGWDFWIALGGAVFVTLLVSLLVGLVLSRFRDDYFLLISLGFTMIAYSVFANWQTVTNGALGIAGIPSPEIFGTSIDFLVIMAVVVLVVYGLCWYIVRSPFGRILQAIREDEEVTQIFGYRTFYYRLFVFVISASVAGLAGGFFAAYITYIDPTSFMLVESVLVLAMVILGGVASLRGSLIGAAVLVILPEALRFLGLPDEVAGQARQAIYGLLLVLLMVYRPQGLVGRYRL